MSRLPDLEHQLWRAAERLEPAPASRARRRTAPLLAGIAALLVAGGATAAVTVVLDTGDPVPQESKNNAVGELKPGSSVVLSLRVPDPDGGPPWGIAVFDATGRSIAGSRVPAASTIRCVRRARVQDGKLGVVGRDGLFNNDGKFHPQPELASSTGQCSGTFADGQLLFSAGGAPTPASGYSGSIETPIGGCLLFRPKRATSSPETRRRLRGKPLCDQSGRRIVKYGFAGRQAVKVTISNRRITRSMKPGPDGEFLFVLRASDAGTQQVGLKVTYRNGVTCSSGDWFGRIRPGHRRPKQGCSPPPGF